MMFVASIQSIHPGITEQNASQLREFLVTARQRHLSDSQTLSLGFQDLKQEVLDEGYDWDDLITILVVLLCTDLQEERHKQFVAELHDLYTNNAILSEVGSLMETSYPSALRNLQLLVQEAQEDHEALAGVAGGTSTWKPDSGRTTKKRALVISTDAVEAIAVGCVGVSLYNVATVLNQAERIPGNQAERIPGDQAERIPGDRAERIFPESFYNEYNEDARIGMPENFGHQEFTNTQFKQFEDNKDIFENINERKLVREGSREIGKFNVDFDKSDSELFGDLNNKIGTADKQERLFDRLLDPNMSFDKDLEEKVSSEAKGELKQGEIEAEQEVREDTRLIEKEVKADADAMAQDEVKTIRAGEEIIE